MSSIWNSPTSARHSGVSHACDYSTPVSGDESTKPCPANRIPMHRSSLEALRAMETTGVIAAFVGHRIAPASTLPTLTLPSAPDLSPHRLRTGRGRPIDGGPVLEVVETATLSKATVLMVTG